MGLACCKEASSALERENGGMAPIMHCGCLFQRCFSSELRFLGEAISLLKMPLDDARNQGLRGCLLSLLGGSP